LIGLAIGLPVGLFMSKSQVAQDTIGSLALGLQTLPSVCWVPLALIWFGQTETAMLFVVVMGSVWSVIIATDHGARTIPPIFVRAARTMGSEGFHQWTRVVLPAVIHKLAYNSMISWANGWYFLIASEIIVIGPIHYRLPGLGSYLAQTMSTGDYTRAIYGIAVLTCMIVVFHLF